MNASKAALQARDVRRIAMAAILLLAVGCYVYCAFQHVCMAGHMHHPPYSVGSHIIDVVWVAGFLIAGFVVWKDRLHFRLAISLLGPLLIFSRLVAGSAGGMFFDFELIALLALSGMAVRNMVSAPVDTRNFSSDERDQHRRRILRRWVLTASVIAAVALAIWGGPKAYQFVKTVTASEIEITEAPASRQIALTKGSACIVRLPGGKTVAIWCTDASWLAEPDEGPLDFEYGEAAFRKIDRTEHLSYIRDGSVISSSDGTRERVLYIDSYALSLIRGSGAKDATSLDLTINLRPATAKELIPEYRRREHYLQALHSEDSKTRLDAIKELGSVVSVAGQSLRGIELQQIIDEIRPLLQDLDEEVRKQALIGLRFMGDEDSILQMLTPRPIKEYAERNGAWAVAHWCGRQSTRRVIEHIEKFLDTDDPELQEFALAFFSVFSIYHPSEIEPYIVKYAKSEVPAVRVAAVSAVRDNCSRAVAATVLAEAMADPSEEVVLGALHEVDRFKDVMHVQPILALLTSKNAKIVTEAAEALEGCRNPAAVEPLLAATRDKTPSIRVHAVAALGFIQDERARSGIVELLKDSDASVRLSALHALLCTAPPDETERVKILARLAKEDSSADVRKAAKEAVRELQR